jgi:uncharacterized protein GlcG (DUF336 family)
MRALSLEQANFIIAARRAAAKKPECQSMSAIVLEAGGRVKAFQKRRRLAETAQNPANPASRQIRAVMCLFAAPRGPI